MKAINKTISLFIVLSFVLTNVSFPFISNTYAENISKDKLKKSALLASARNKLGDGIDSFFDVQPGSSDFKREQEPADFLLSTANPKNFNRLKNFQDDVFPAQGSSQYSPNSDDDVETLIRKADSLLGALASVVDLASHNAGLILEEPFILLMEM